MSLLDGPRLAPLSGAARQLVVLLHGYGSDGNDLIALGKIWQTRFPDAAFVAPNAPEPVGGASSGYQWFGLDRIDPKANESGADGALPALDAFIDAELAALRLEGENLVLMGFSQGAMMALYAGLRRTVAPMGILSYSGLLPGRIPVPAPGGSYPPVFISHGDSDTVVPPQMMFMAVGALQQVDAVVDWHLARQTGHGIDPESLELGAKFLESALKPQP